jgi:uncharacterized protein (DUF1330 family)
MAGYILAEVEVTDPEQYQVYARQTSATVEKYGGKFLVRGGPYETLEGNSQGKRLVVLEFPSVEQARAWYDSPEYSAIRGIRQRAAISQLLLVQGA